MDWSKCLVSDCSFVTIYWKVVLFIYLFICLLLPSVDLWFYFELCDVIKCVLGLGVEIMFLSCVAWGKIECIYHFHYVIAATCSLNNDLEFLLDLVWCWLKIDLILVGFWHTSWCDLASAEILIWLKYVAWLHECEH